MGRPAASVGAAAGRVSVWRRDSGARHGFTVAKRIPATCMVVVRGLRPLSVRCERRATAHYFVELQPAVPARLAGDFNRCSFMANYFPCTAPWLTRLHIELKPQVGEADLGLPDSFLLSGQLRTHVGHWWCLWSLEGSLSSLSR